MSAVAHIAEYKKGTYFTEEFRGAMSWNGYENNVLLRNEGIGADGVPRFTDVGMALGADDIRDGRAVAAADFDNDGDLDLAITPSPGDAGVPGVPAALLRNELGQDHRWLAVELIGERSNRDGVGATIHVEVGGDTLMRLVSAGSGYASQASRRVYFGLGAAERVDRITVRWPSGQVDRFGEAAADQLVRITEGGEVRIGPLPGDDRS